MAIVARIQDYGWHGLAAVERTFSGVGGVRALSKVCSQFQIGERLDAALGKQVFGSVPKPCGALFAVANCGRVLADNAGKAVRFFAQPEWRRDIQHLPVLGTARNYVEIVSSVGFAAQVFANSTALGTALNVVDLTADVADLGVIMTEERRDDGPLVLNHMWKQPVWIQEQVDSDKITLGRAEELKVIVHIDRVLRISKIAVSILAAGAAFALFTTGVGALAATILTFAGAVLGLSSNLCKNFLSDLKDRPQIVPGVVQA